MTMRALERTSPGGVKTWRGEAMALRVGGALLTTLVWIGAIVCIFPLVWMVVSSFRPDQSFIVSPFPTTFQEFTLSNYGSIFSLGTFPSGFQNSAIQVVIILVTTLLFCPLAGFGFAKFAFRGQRVLFGLMMLTLFFVPLTQYIPLLIEMNAIGWLDTYQALVLPLVITSFGVFFMTGAIRAIPDELLQAARIDGCGHVRTWWRIVMPLILPAQVSLAVVTFLTSYNDYFWPLLVLRSPSMLTIQIDLALLSSDPRMPSVAATSNFGPYLAGCTLVILPTVIIFLVMQRYFLRGVLQGGIKG